MGNSNHKEGSWTVFGRSLRDIEFMLNYFNLWYGQDWTQDEVRQSEEIENIRKTDDRTKRDIWYEANTRCTCTSDTSVSCPMHGNKGNGTELDYSIIHQGAFINLPPGETI